MGLGGFWVSVVHKRWLILTSKSNFSKLLPSGTPWNRQVDIKKYKKNNFTDLLKEISH
jgi:hypothetical protein